MSLEEMKDLHLEEKYLQPETKEVNGILMTKMISDNWDKSGISKPSLMTFSLQPTQKQVA